MPKNHDLFEERLHRIESRKTVAVRKKNAEDFGIQGVSAPKKRKMPWKRVFTLLALLVLGFYLIKTVIFLNMGQESYDNRVAELAAGDTYAQAAAFVMARGPVSQIIEFYLSGETAK